MIRKPLHPTEQPTALKSNDACAACIYRELCRTDWHNWNDWVCVNIKLAHRSASYRVYGQPLKSCMRGFASLLTDVCHED